LEIVVSFSEIHIKSRTARGHLPLAENPTA